MQSSQDKGFSAVTKKEIVKAISEELGLTQLQTKAIVQKTFESIIDTLVEDPKHRIELRNFGVFEVKKRAARKARNPRTNERVDVEEKYVVTFKPGKEMEERVSQLMLDKERQAAESENVSASAEISPSTPIESTPTAPLSDVPPESSPAEEIAEIESPPVSSPYNQ
ncbi:Integration host factor subunit beta [Rubinisphaera italica]|uniref:Integration host factor subunit beta n=1 Tax=Rubinisphaera italica TaxID=2527969 RepID=A0A5C5XG87_9PLAN|nr:Integration host factor subunit beta [Rubinisphaera italica]